MVKAASVSRRQQIAGHLRSLAGWWPGLSPEERVLYRAVALLGIGCGLVYPPLVLIVPGFLFALTFFGFGRRT